VVDADHQVIVAAELGTNASDVATLLPMTEQTVTNTGVAPGQVLADAGYSSTANLDAAAEFTATCGTEFFIAPGRRRRDDPPPVGPARAYPHWRDRQAADGPQADHQTRTSRLRPP
jgi:hypothetical protein